MKTKLFTGVAGLLLLGSAAAAQNITIGNTGPDMAEVLKKPVPKTQKQWWPLWHEMIAKLRGPIVGDSEEPELGVNLDKIQPIIPSPVDINTLLTPSWGTGEIAPTGKPDVVGAFRFMCAAGQVNRDDPIVFPNQPGKSHLHQWFGNLGGKASSTYKSLRTTGDTTCGNILNRSAYWMPAMLNGRGQVVRPDYVSSYYKRIPASSPDCNGVGERAMAQRCTGIARGLRYIFGYDMMKGGDQGQHGTWGCDGPTAVKGAFASLADVAKVCTVGNRIFVTLGGPTCWDGKRLDSPNHRDHVGSVGYGDWGYPKCDKDHPVMMPGFLLGVFWMVAPGDDPTEWYLSSDDMTAMGMGRRKAGTTWHGDIIDAWDDEVEQSWIDNCINKLLSCSGGDLGNGKQLKDTTGFDWTAHPHLVDIPAA